MLIALAFVFIASLVIFLVVSYHPKVFSFHAKIMADNGNMLGEAFKSSDGLFLVRLRSGTLLTVETDPPKAFLSRSARRNGFRVGRYLIVSASDVGGVDLSKSEGFTKQVPIISEGRITLKDPMQQDGPFSFPAQ